MRAIEIEELEALLANREEYELAADSVSRIREFASNETVVIEVRSPWDLTEQMQAAEKPSHMVAALQLLGFEVAGDGRATVTSVLRLNHLLESPVAQPMAVFSAGPVKTVNMETLSQLATLVSQLSDFELRRPKERRDVAVARFCSGMCTMHSDPGDVLLDLTVALEALLLPDASSELAFRLRTNAAWLLHPDDLSARRMIANQMSEIHGQLQECGHMADVDRLRRRKRHTRRDAPLGFRRHR